MPSDVHSADAPRRLPRWILTACDLLVVAAGLLFVLRYQYDVRWLHGRDLALDGIFLGTVALAALARVAVRQGLPRAGGAVARVALAAVMTAIAIVACEQALRYLYRNVHASGDARDYIANHRELPGPAARFNSLGLRDREVTPKAAGRYRIAVVGDSFTFGNGLEEKDRLTNQLERQLGDRYEVFNFGLGGNNLPEHLLMLEKALRADPDFVLLQLYINDFETAEMERPTYAPLLPGDLHRSLYASSLFYDMLARGWNRVQELTGITDSFATNLRKNLGDANQPASVKTSAQLREFFRRARAAGVGVGAVLYPAVDAMGRGGKGYPFAFLHDRVRSICSEEQVRCVDLLEDFSRVTNLQTLKVTPLDAHPSAAANRMAMVSLLQSFRSEWSTR